MAQIMARRRAPKATVPTWVQKAQLKALQRGEFSFLLFGAKYQMQATAASTNIPTLLIKATCHSKTNK